MLLKQYIWKSSMKEKPRKKYMANFEMFNQA